MDESYRLARLSMLKKLLERDNIKVVKTLSGVSFSISLYYDHNTIKSEDVIKQIEDIYNKLKEKFSN
jgi:hypothetical protein